MPHIVLQKLGFNGNKQYISDRSRPHSGLSHPDVNINPPYLSDGAELRSAQSSGNSAFQIRCYEYDERFDLGLPSGVSVQSGYTVYASSNSGSGAIWRKGITEEQGTPFLNARTGGHTPHLITSPLRIDVSNLTTGKWCYLWLWWYVY